MTQSGRGDLAIYQGLRKGGGRFRIYDLRVVSPMVATEVATLPSTWATESTSTPTTRRSTSVAPPASAGRLLLAYTTPTHLDPTDAHLWVITGDLDDPGTIIAILCPSD